MIQALGGVDNEDVAVPRTRGDDPDAELYIVFDSLDVADLSKRIFPV